MAFGFEMWAKRGQSRTQMPSIPQCPGITQNAAVQMLGDGWPSKPALFNWQSMPSETFKVSHDAKLHQYR